MAEKLESYGEFTRPVGGQGSKWDQYVDGGIYRLRRGEDYGHVQSVRSRIWSRLKIAGKNQTHGLRTHVEDGGAAIVVQVVEKEAAS